MWGSLGCLALDLFGFFCLAQSSGNARFEVQVFTGFRLSSWTLNFLGLDQVLVANRKLTCFRHHPCQSFMAKWQVACFDHLATTEAGCQLALAD